MVKLTARPQLYFEKIHYLAYGTKIKTEKQNKLTNIVMRYTYTIERAHARAHAHATLVVEEYNTVYCVWGVSVRARVRVHVSVLFSVAHVTKRHVVLFAHGRARIVDMHTHGSSHSENKKTRKKEPSEGEITRHKQRNDIHVHIHIEN